MSQPFTSLQPIASSPSSSLILVVDDEAITRRTVATFLKKNGHHIITATDGQQAIEQFDKHAPDIILMDAVMPHMDGFEACKAIQARTNAQKTPVIMVTSLQDNASVDQAFRAGAIDYITKPIHSNNPL